MNQLAHGEQSQQALPGQSVSSGIYDYLNFLPKTSLAVCGSRARTSEFVIECEVDGYGYNEGTTAHSDNTATWPITGSA